MGKITVKHYLNKNLKSRYESKASYYPIYVSIIVNSKNIKRKSNIFDSASEKDLKINKNIISEINYEKGLFERIIQLFIRDVENNNVNKKYLYVFSGKGYNSKDDFINQMNSYLDFYSCSIFTAIAKFCDNEINNEIYAKLAGAFNLDLEETKRVFAYKAIFENRLNITYTKNFLLKNISASGIELLVFQKRMRDFTFMYRSETGYDIPYMDWVDNKIQNKLRHFLETYKEDRNKSFLIPSKNEIREENYLPDVTFTNNLIEKYIKLIDDIISTDYYVKSMLDF